MLVYYDINQVACAVDAQCRRGVGRIGASEL